MQQTKSIDREILEFFGALAYLVIGGAVMYVFWEQFKEMFSVLGALVCFFGIPVLLYKQKNNA